jgi:hypothetical protein
MVIVRELVEIPSKYTFVTKGSQSADERMAEAKENLDY